MPKLHIFYPVAEPNDDDVWGVPDQPLLSNTKRRAYYGRARVPRRLADWWFAEGFYKKWWWRRDA
jgi:hypothetical protein